jgi:hypothetical protein
MTGGRRFGLMSLVSMAFALVSGCSGPPSGEEGEQSPLAEAREELGRCATMLCAAGTVCYDDGTTARCLPPLNRQCGTSTCVGIQRCCLTSKPHCANPFEVCPILSLPK